MEAVFEGARKAGSGLGEAVGDILSETLVVGDAGEAVAGVARASRARRTAVEGRDLGQARHLDHDAVDGVGLGVGVGVWV